MPAMTIYIAVGSTNPVKIAAAQVVLSRAFSHAEFSGVTVPSGVPNQPWGDEQTRLGAFNRAVNALAQTGADFGLGLEGGVVETPAGLMTCAWGAMVDETGRAGFGGGVKMLLPPAVAEQVRRNGELGPAMDMLVNQRDTKRGLGAVGILTGGLSTRQAAYEQLVAMAAAPFVTDFYEYG